MSAGPIGQCDKCDMIYRHSPYISHNCKNPYKKKLVLVRSEGSFPFVYFESMILCEDNTDYMKKEFYRFLKLYENSNKAETGSDGNDYGMSWCTFEV